MAIKDMVGKRFERLTVISRHGNTNTGQASWLCECDCGKNVVVNGSNLRRGNSRSCGCLKAEKTSQAKSTHRMSQTKLYRVWAAMISRCYNRNSSGFEHYGGRGIGVCDRWFEFENFYRDMGNPLPKQTLERIDNDADYSPDNCRWATMREQARNRRSTHYLTIDNLSLSIAEWASRTGIKPSIISERVRRGWPHKEAAFKPTRAINKKK